MSRKKKSQMIHLRRRWSERIGGNLTRSVYEQIIGKIRSNQTVHVRRTSNRTTVHDVTVGKERYQVVYDKVRKQLVTVLPRKEANNVVSNES